MDECVGHQRGCKVVTSGTSVKINVFLRSLFIHCAAAELTGIFSDIMNLKDCVRFSDSLVLPQQLKTRSGGISPMVEKNWGGLSF